MPRTIQLSEDDVSFLEQNHDAMTLVDLAKRIGCCVDTLKRILVRLELREFEGAKYVIARTQTVKMWDRPCMDCGDKEERPKGHYFCKPCRVKRGYDDDD